MKHEPTQIWYPGDSLTKNLFDCTQRGLHHAQDFSELSLVQTLVSSTNQNLKYTYLNRAA